MSQGSGRLPEDWLAAARRSSSAHDLSALGGRQRTGLSVLSLGVPPAPLAERLRTNQFSLTFAVDLKDLFWLLARRRFDAIVALPDEEGAQAVRMLKLEEGEKTVRPELHFMAIQNNGNTPVYLLPMPGELALTVVVSLPEPIYFFRTDRFAVEWVMSHLDAESILDGAPS